MVGWKPTLQLCRYGGQECPPYNLTRHCEPDQSQAWQSPKIIFNKRSEVENYFRVA